MRIDVSRLQRMARVLEVAERREHEARTDQDRARELRAVCRAGFRLATSRADGERLLTLRDSLPESTLVALARLRRRAPDRER